jgi:hypothetical protein
MQGFHANQYSSAPTQPSASVLSIQAHPDVGHFIVDAFRLVKPIEKVDDIGSAGSSLNPELRAGLQWIVRD